MYTGFNKFRHILSLHEEMFTRLMRKQELLCWLFEILTEDFLELSTKRAGAPLSSRSTTQYPPSNKFLLTSHIPKQGLNTVPSETEYAIKFETRINSMVSPY